MKAEIVHIVCGTATGLAAIGGIILIECKALAAGIDGVLLTASFGAICAIGGYKIKGIKEVIKRLVQ